METNKVTYDGRQVEIIDFFTGSGGRRLALVKRITGEKFQQYTHGGWCESDYANAPVDLIHIEQDECHCVLPEQSCPACRNAARELCEIDEFPY